VWAHLGHIIGVIVAVFFESIGTTLLGRAVDIAFAGSIAVAVLYQKKQEGGWRLMFEHWRAEYRAGLRFALWAAIIIYTPVVVWSVGKAVYDDHQNLVGSTARIITSLKKNAGTAKSDLAAKQIECAKQSGQNEILQNQNRNQQGTINGCLTQAIKLLKPADLVVSPIVLDHIDESPSPPNKATRYILLINRDVDALRVHLKCKVALSDMSASMLGGLSFPAQVQPVFEFPATEVQVSVRSWSPTSVLLVRSHSSVLDDANCGFSVN
jgi:hypothetical protein